MSRLPRAAERSTHAWEAHRDKDPALDAQGATMVAAAEQYRAAQTVHHDRQTQAAVKRQHRTVAVEQLQTTKRRFLLAVGRDVPDFDTTGFTDSQVPEDATAQGRELHDRFEVYMREGTAPPYAESLLTILAASVAAAEVAARAAYEAETQAQQARDDRKRAALHLDQKLIAFRNILRTVLGSRHRDYRTLRAFVAHPIEADLDQLDEAEPTPAPAESDNDNDNATPDQPAETGTG
jgi:hypothetical protein